MAVIDGRMESKIRRRWNVAQRIGRRTIVPVSEPGKRVTPAIVRLGRAPGDAESEAKDQSDLLVVTHRSTSLQVASAMGRP